MRLNIKADVTCFGELTGSKSFVLVDLIFPLQTSLVIIYAIIYVNYQRY